VYLTRIHTELAGDTFFPALPAYFRLTWQEAHPADDRHAYAYTFQLWKQG
jgi:dihydrofolate reductase